MRERFLTAADREKLSTFPLDIPEDDVIRFFTLSPSDRQIVNQCRSQHNRLGFSLQLCALRYRSMENANTPEPTIFKKLSFT